MLQREYREDSRNREVLRKNRKKLIFRGYVLRNLLEVRSSGSNLVDNVFNGEDTVLAKGLLNDLVGGESNSLLVDLSISTLVDQLADSLEVRLTVECSR